MSNVPEEEWEEFKLKFKKNYKNEEEETMRRELYKNAKAIIEDHNRKFEAGEVSYSMTINHLSDLTKEEFAMRRGKERIPE